LGIDRLSGGIDDTLNSLGAVCSWRYLSKFCCGDVSYHDISDIDLAIGLYPVVTTKNVSAIAEAIALLTAMIQ
jgi:hypothetical protein